MLPIRNEAMSQAANILSNIWDLGANLMVTLVLLFFMLATGDTFLKKVVAATPRLSDAKAVVATSLPVDHLGELSVDH